ncbi:DoxX family protein [Sphingobacterium prati]|uniref:DoxX family protein n=1 Tax=Sphingobacterium prati TaxID=2737006 RepID=UPI0015555A54|nr:DoxX family protein [Sphingobacterium prati]NPE47379.1 DoxX family protein [Sphingobacterium prati]
MKKSIKIIYWISTVWLSLGLVSTAIIQIFKIQTEGAGGVQNVAHLGYPDYILSLLGIWKILAAIALLLSKRPLLKEWAYAGIFFTATGALYSHLMVGDAFDLMAPALLYLILIAVSWYFRPAEKKLR